MMNKVLIVLLIVISCIIIGTGLVLFDTGLLQTNSQNENTNSSKNNVKESPQPTIGKNFTSFNVQFLLYDRHIPSSFQVHMQDGEFSDYDNIAPLITTQDDQLGVMEFYDNSSGTMTQLPDCGNVVCFPNNSNNTWMVDTLSNEYSINVTETADPDVNPYIEKGFVKTDNDGYQKHYFKINVKPLIKEYANMSDQIAPFVVFYLFYNNPTVEPLIKECTNLHNDVINKSPDWDYASAKFAVECTQTDIFNGNWN